MFGGQGAFGTPSAFGGQQSAFGAQPQGGFGQQSAFGGGGSAFGAPVGGAFGAPVGGGAFGAPAGGGAFGGQSAFGGGGGAFGSPGQSAFGRTGPATSPGYGLGGGGGAGFGTSSMSGFGSAPAGAAFGTPNPSFGGGGNAGGFGSSSSLFGSANNRTVYGSPQMGGNLNSGTGFSSGFAGGPRTEQHNPGNELEIKPEERPTDSITSMRFSPTLDPSQQFLCVSSWDQSIRVYQHLMQANACPAKAMVQAQAPIFDSCFRSDGGAIFGACADGTVQVWNIASGANQLQPIGRHDAPCKSVHWIPEFNLAVSASWDKTIRYWDLRQQQAAQIIRVENTIHAMSVKANVMVVACSGPTYPIILYDLKNPQVPVRQKALSVGSPNQNQPKLSVRSIAISTDGQFYCCAGVEGRVYIHFIDESKSSKNFTFRAHKTEDAVKSLKFHNSINDIQFHPKSNATATAGSDGAYCFWDIAERSRLHHGPQAPTGSASQPMQSKRCMFPGGDRPAPILASAFNAEGSVYAYGVGYDWNAGPQWNIPSTQVNAVVLHYIKPDELRPKKKA